MKVWRNNGLTIVLVALFAVSLGGHLLAGWSVHNHDLARDGARTLSVGQYALSAHFVSSVFENWESEFLQMSAYVVLTAMLFQRGSAESKDPDAEPRDEDLMAQASWPGAPAILRAGTAARWLYAHSLGLTLFTLFLLSFALHWTASARVANTEALSQGEAAQSTLAYLGDAQLWFESFQNWQSEFLSTAVLVVLSIFLRQRESPEAKSVAAPHNKTGSD